jgi:hypothetical protein
MSIDNCEDCRDYHSTLGRLMNMAQEAEPPGKWPVDMERLVDAILDAYDMDGNPPSKKHRPEPEPRYRIDLTGKPGGAMPAEYYRR